MYPKVNHVEEEESFSYAMQLARSMALPMVLKTAVELKVFDIIATSDPDAKLSAVDIATQITSKNPEAATMLDRILRLLATHSVLHCSLVEDQQKLGSFQRLYSLNSVSKYFVLDDDGMSLGNYTALVQHKVILDSWSQLKEAVVEGGIPFNRAHGCHAFEYLGLDAKFNGVFNTAMVSLTTMVMKKILEVYNGFENISTLVDVGGGLGLTINLIVSKYQHIHGINFDLAHAIQHAPPYPGVEHVKGDMFESVPKGDAIIMKWVLHDWSDERCLKVLKKCYDAIPQNGKVIVVEAVVPGLPETNAAAKNVSHLDIQMMTINPGGKERTKQEFIELATTAGFRAAKFDCYVYNQWIIEFFK
ncbi:hypothetical protein L6164_013780 [Bauhinia variegata]|uniref:Uncharacterized protein n=1 Tax=Bauhinia variegata TaxID=167791 RepID=A0ACB9NIW4_BAUVA|nr:hypothetical protein L6164_013780 [Bauhinia variegata]